MNIDAIIFWDATWNIYTVDACRSSSRNDFWPSFSTWCQRRPPQIASRGHWELGIATLVRWDGQKSLLLLLVGTLILWGYYVHGAWFSNLKTVSVSSSGGGGGFICIKHDIIFQNTNVPRRPSVKHGQIKSLIIWGSYTNDGVWHWQVGSHQRQVALFLTYDTFWHILLWFCFWKGWYLKIESQCFHQILTSLKIMERSLKYPWILSWEFCVHPDRPKLRWTKRDALHTHTPLWNQHRPTLNLYRWACVWEI